MTREEIQALRFAGTRKDGKPKDVFLGAMMDLFFLRNEIGALFGKRRIKKQLEQCAVQLGLDKCAAQNEETKRLFVDEYRAAGKFFIDISREDSAYSTGVLNLRSLKKAELAEKVRRDFELIGKSLPEIAGMEDVYAPFLQGIMEAHEAAFEQDTDPRRD